MSESSEPSEHSASLQKMLMDTRIRKLNKMLYMPNPINHPINDDKINEWVSLQCSSDAQILARLFRDYTTHISWETFYSDCIRVFEKLYKFIGDDKSYCFFTKGVLGSKDWSEKSNYWMINLLLDYYINSGKTNLPKELLIWHQGTDRPQFKKETDYDFYIILDDVSYSGGQTFRDQIKHLKTGYDINIDPQKIFIVCPYVSESAYNTYFIDRRTRYNTLFHSVIMKYWWRDIKVTLDSQEYDLNVYTDRQQIYQKIIDNFDIGNPIAQPLVENPKVLKGDNNSMYYFDHKIADMVSSFPYIYQLGTIRSIAGILNKFSRNTYDDTRTKNVNVCQQQRYLPFINNCAIEYPIRSDDINKLCVQPWYKKIYENIHKDYILALDFDETITNIDLSDQDVIVKHIASTSFDTIFKNKESLIEILNLAWKHLITIYIVSRRKISQIIFLLNTFYEANSIIYQKIFEENIYGMSDDYIKPAGRSLREEEQFWANKKLENLIDIVRKKQIANKQILFCDDNQLNISTTSAGGFNSILINKKENANQVLAVLNTFIKQNKIPLCDISNIPDKYILAVDLNNIVHGEKQKTGKKKYDLSKPLETFLKVDILIKILNLALQYNITICIVSSIQKEEKIIPTLNRFYSEYHSPIRIEEDNIFGRINDLGWTMSGVSADIDRLMKLTHLETIFETNNVKKENILFLDDNPKTIEEAIQYEFTNSIIIDSIDDILDTLKLFIIKMEIPAKQSAGAKDTIRKSIRNNKNMREIRKSVRKNTNMRKNRKSIRKSIINNKNMRKIRKSFIHKQKQII